MSKSDRQEFERLGQEEKNLTFQSFSRADALSLGLTILDYSKKFSDPIAVEITINGLVVFRHFTDGSMADSEYWLERKRNSVELMGMSSLRFRSWLAVFGQTLKERLLNPQDYATFGGGFPLLLEGTGMIGSICVSGLPDDLEDHACIVESIRQMQQPS